jgi:hypothetical protein
MAGGAAAFVAPAASAAVTQVGTCKGGVTLDKITPPLSDQTVNGTKIAGALAKDKTTLAVIGGVCKGVSPLTHIPVRPGDPHIPQPSGDLHPKIEAISLLGNTGCASGAGAVAVDGNAANAWPEAGTVTFTFTETYTDIVTAAVKNYQMKSNISLLGFNPTYAPDTVDLGGVNVNSGVGAGLTVTGSVWEDPVKKGTDGPPTTDIYNTGYVLDLGNAIGCADGTAGNATIAQVLSGGGGASQNSPLGTTGVPGIAFQTGE